MKGKQHLALLRGINVGGKNIIKMAELKACFEKMGLLDVATYIQSGNVLFRVSGKDRSTLIGEIEGALSKRFNYESRVVVVSQNQLVRLVKHAPKGFGDKPKDYRYDVVFLRHPLTAREAIASVRTREGVDRVYAGQGVLYFSRLVRRITQSYLSKIVQLPIYQQMTIRNWNTTTKLLALMQTRAQK